MRSQVNYWLIKSEPQTYSIDDLERDGRTTWEGVRNFRARNYMKEMKEGDLVLFYHSSAEPPGVAGVAKVVREAYPDPTQFDSKSKYHDAKSTSDKPRWWLVDVGFVEKLDRLVTLSEIKAEPALGDMVLVNNSRLSVQPVKKAEFERLKRMAKSAA
jgi:predicted RNA-binding protein with PUA-like domain